MEKQTYEQNFGASTGPAGLGDRMQNDLILFGGFKLVALESALTGSRLNHPKFGGKSLRAPNVQLVVGLDVNRTKHRHDINDDCYSEHHCVKKSVVLTKSGDVNSAARWAHQHKLKVKSNDEEILKYDWHEKQQRSRKIRNLKQIDNKVIMSNGKNKVKANNKLQHALNGNIVIVDLAVDWLCIPNLKIARRFNEVDFENFIWMAYNGFEENEFEIIYGDETQHLFLIPGGLDRRQFMRRFLTLMRGMSNNSFMHMLNGNIEFDVLELVGGKNTCVLDTMCHILDMNLNSLYIAVNRLKDSNEKTMLLIALEAVRTTPQDFKGVFIGVLKLIPQLSLSNGNATNVQTYFLENGLLVKSTPFFLKNCKKFRSLVIDLGSNHVAPLKVVKKGLRFADYERANKKLFDINQEDVDNYQAVEIKATSSSLDLDTKALRIPPGFTLEDRIQPNVNINESPVGVNDLDAVLITDVGLPRAQNWKRPDVSQVLTEEEGLDDLESNVGEIQNPAPVIQQNQLQFEDFPNVPNHPPVVARVVNYLDDAPIRLRVSEVVGQQKPELDQLHELLLEKLTLNNQDTVFVDSVIKQMEYCVGSDGAVVHGDWLNVTMASSQLFNGNNYDAARKSKIAEMLEKVQIHHVDALDQRANQTLGRPLMFLQKNETGYHSWRHIVLPIAIILRGCLRFASNILRMDVKPMFDFKYTPIAKDDLPLSRIKKDFNLIRGTPRIDAKHGIYSMAPHFTNDKLKPVAPFNQVFDKKTMCYFGFGVLMLYMSYRYWKSNYIKYIEDTDVVGNNLQVLLVEDHVVLKNFRKWAWLYDYLPIIHFCLPRNFKSMFSTIYYVRRYSSAFGFVSLDQTMNHGVRKVKTLMTDKMTEATRNGCKVLTRNDMVRSLFMSPVKTDALSLTIDNLVSGVIKVNVPRLNPSLTINPTAAMRPQRPTSQYTKVLYGKYKTDVYVLLDNPLVSLVEPERVGLYNCDVNNFEYALRNRIIFDYEADKDHAFSKSYIKYMKRFKYRIAARKCLEMVDKIKFIEQHYVGEKRRKYLEAAGDDSDKIISKRDMNIKAFIKKEPMIITKNHVLKEFLNPRPIQMRSGGPKVIVNVGLQFKNFEHMIYQATRTFNTEDRLPEVAKTMNPQQRLEVILKKWQSLCDPVCIGLDGSNFDARLPPWLIQLEMDVYLQIYKGFGKTRQEVNLLRSILKNQVDNKCTYQDKTGKIKYNVQGNRMSGDWNTALGNIILMSTNICHLCKYLKIPQKCFKIFDDGDDILLFVERKFLPVLHHNLTNLLGKIGMDMKIKLFNTIEDIEFCQMRIALDVRTGVYVIMKDPQRLLSRYQHQVLYNELDEGFLRKIKAQALSDVITYENMPFVHNFVVNIFKSIKNELVVDDYKYVNDYRITLPTFKKALATHVIEEIDDQNFYLVHKYADHRLVRLMADEFLATNLELISEVGKYKKILGDHRQRLRVMPVTPERAKCDEVKQSKMFGTYPALSVAPNMLNFDQAFSMQNNMIMKRSGNKIVNRAVKTVEKDLRITAAAELEGKILRKAAKKGLKKVNQKMIVNENGKMRQVLIPTTPDIGKEFISRTKRRIEKHPLSAKFGTAMARRLLEQSLMPYSSNYLERYPDENASDVGILKSWQNSAVFPLVASNAGYFSIIHTGKTNAQFMQTINAFPPNATFTVANFSTFGGDSNSLVDTVQSSAAIPRLSRSIASGSSAVIPLRTGYFIDQANNSYMWSPSSSYDTNGNIVTSNVTGTAVGALAPNTGFACGGASSGVTATVSFIFNSTGAGVISFYIGRGNGSVVADALIGTYTAAIGYNSGTITGNFNFGAGFGDRICGGSVAVGTLAPTTASIGFLELQMSLTWNTGILSVVSNVVTPYSLYGGVPAKSAPSILPSVSQERTIASSLLISDFSSALYASGTLAAVQIKSGTYPAESLVTGVESASSYNKSFVGYEAKGCYSAPGKLIDVNSRQFYDCDLDWQGVQPYTAVYIKVPNSSTITITLRLQIADIIEYKCDNQQILMVSSAYPDNDLVCWLKYMMDQENEIQENPLHIEDIMTFINKAMSKLNKLHPLVQSMAALAF